MTHGYQFLISSSKNYQQKFNVAKKLLIVKRTNTRSQSYRVYLLYEKIEIPLCKKNIILLC